MGTVGRGDYRNYYKGHRTESRRRVEVGREVGSTGVGWRDVEKRHTTVIV